MNFWKSMGSHQLLVIQSSCVFSRTGLEQLKARVSKWWQNFYFLGELHSKKKRYESYHWGGTFSKGTLLYLKGAYWDLHIFVQLWYQYAPFRYKSVSWRYQYAPFRFKSVPFWKGTAPVTVFVPFFLTVYPFDKAIDHFTRCKQHWSRNTSCFSL